jgi:hypothetical protein
MPKDATFTMRMGTELLQRVADLAAVMQNTPEAVAWGVSKSGVVRMAMQIGLESLEARYGTPTHTVRHHAPVPARMAAPPKEPADDASLKAPLAPPPPDPTKRWCSVCQRTIPTARWEAHLKTRAHADD